MSERNVPEVRFRGFIGKWERYSLKSYTKYRRGSFPQPYGNKEWYDGEHSMPFVQVVDVTDRLSLSSDTKQRISKLAQDKSVFVPKGTVVVTLQGSIGRVAITQYDSYVDRTILIFTDYKEQTNRSFWAYTIQLKFDLEKQKAPGGTIKTITKEALSAFEVCVSQPDEQTKIGEFFKNLDNLIAQNQKKYNKLVNMKKACLDKMFPKDEADTPEVRFKGFSGKWEACNLKESSQSLEYGLNAAATKFDGENKYIRITDIDDELRIFLKNDLSSPYIDLGNADNYKLKKGDIVFARTGASVGKSYKYNESEGLVYYAGFLIRARIKPEYNTTFIFQNTLTKEYKKYIQITSQRSGQPGVNAQEYSEFSFFVPSFNEQTKIGTFFQNLDNLITLQKTKLEKLKNIKKACLDKMFI